MKRVWLPITVFAATLVAWTPASAQQKGQVGLVMGYPTSVGVQFQVSDGVALRPGLSFSKGSGTSSYLGTASGQVTESDGYGVGIGVDALFYFKKWSSLRAYLTPGFSYNRGSTTNSNSALLYENKSTTNIYEIRGSFGAQYTLSRRFGVLGEVGVDYSDQESDSVPVGGTGGSSSSSKSFSTRAAVAVVFYLN